MHALILITSHNYHPFPCNTMILLIHHSISLIRLYLLGLTIWKLGWFFKYACAHCLYVHYENCISKQTGIHALATQISLTFRAKYFVWQFSQYSKCAMCSTNKYTCPITPYFIHCTNIWTQEKKPCIQTQPTSLSIAILTIGRIP